MKIFEGKIFKKNDIMSFNGILNYERANIGASPKTSKFLLDGLVDYIKSGNDPKGLDIIMNICVRQNTIDSTIKIVEFCRDNKLINVKFNFGFLGSDVFWSKEDECYYNEDDYVVMAKFCELVPKTDNKMIFCAETTKVLHQNINFSNNTLSILYIYNIDLFLHHIDKINTDHVDGYRFLPFDEPYYIQYADIYKNKELLYKKFGVAPINKVLSIGENVSIEDKISIGNKYLQHVYDIEDVSTFNEILKSFINLRYLDDISIYDIREIYDVLFALINGDIIDLSDVDILKVLNMYPEKDVVTQYHSNILKILNKINLDEIKIVIINAIYYYRINYFDEDVSDDEDLCDPMEILVADTILPVGLKSEIISVILDKYYGKCSDANKIRIASYLLG